MEKVVKKEIRLTYYLTNDEDKKIYEELTSHTQPGRFAKDLIANSIKSNSNNDGIDVNLETLKLLERLTDKIDNLKIETVVTETGETVTKDKIQEISLTGEVNADDIDIEF